MTTHLLASPFLVLALAAPAFAQDHLALVQQIRRDLTAAGTLPVGIVNLDNQHPCGVFEITRRVAWALRAEGTGLLHKPTGNRCEYQGTPYSMDFVVYSDGRSADIAIGGIFDGVLTDAAPAWNLEAIPAHVGRWRPPVDPGPAIPPAPDPDPLPPPPTPPSDPSASDHDALLALLADLERQVADLRAFLQQTAVTLQQEHDAASAHHHDEDDEADKPWWADLLLDAAKAAPAVLTVIIGLLKGE